MVKEKPQPVIQEIVQEVKTEIQKPEVIMGIKEVPEVQEKLQPQIKAEQQKEIIKPKPEKKKVKKETKTDFMLILKNYFNTKNIKVIEENTVKKGKETDYVVEISSQVGSVRFFLSAKDKNKINDADLSLAHNKSQLKKLPLMILTNGELTKQAKEYINNNYLIFEKI